MLPMKIKGLIKASVILALLFIVSFLSYKKFFKKAPKELYTSHTIQKRNISQIINTSGILNIQDRLKVGSFISGIVKEIFVDENNEVKKNQLLAIIETGRNRTEVEEAEGNLYKAKAQFEYLTNYHKRQKALFKSDQISQEAFELSARDLVRAKADVKIYSAILERKKIDYENTKIKSPGNGIVTAVGVTVGERVSTDLKATVLFEIAKDVKKMEALLEIDESDIAFIHKEQTVTFDVDSYPNRLFKGVITEIGYSPKIKTGNKYYQAIVAVDNSKHLFRPGMTINAKITIANVKNAISIDTQCFMINAKHLEAIARTLDFTYKKFTPNEKKEFEKENPDKQIKYVWTVQDKTFTEKAIILGITDDIHFEVLSGLSEIDKVIIDVEESDTMEKIYKKMFSKF